MYGKAKPVEVLNEPALGQAKRYLCISAQAYNEPADYERLAAALAARGA